MLFSPQFWREHFKPGVKAIIDYCHSKDLPVIYHGCGNVSAILEDYIEIGVDAMNPLEAKAGMDAVELREQYGHRLGICGNSNMQIWETGDRDRIRDEVLRKLQSDHSVAADVSGETYEYIVKLVREHGKYPITTDG